MKILLISGFLGAGKTTFICELTKRTGRDFAVLENEYGDIGIDSNLIENDSRDNGEAKINIWELVEGCICCSMKSNFAESILTIANTIDPEYLVVEPTGVGLLSRILENVSKIEYERISLLKPITIVDGTAFDNNLRDYPDIYHDQIAASGCILVSKMEGASESELAQLEKKLRDINPAAEIITKHYSGQDKVWWKSTLERSYRPGAVSESSSDIEPPDLENLALGSVSLESGNQLVLFLNGVVSGVFGKITRSKGYLPCGEAWLRFDTVGPDYSITGIDEMPDTRAIFIGKDLRRDYLRQVLQKDLIRDSAQHLPD